MPLWSQEIIIDSRLGEDLGYMSFCTGLLNCLSGNNEREIGRGSFISAPWHFQNVLWSAETVEHFLVGIVSM